MNKYPGESKASIAGHKVAAFLKNAITQRTIAFIIAFPILFYSGVALFNLGLFISGAFNHFTVPEFFTPDIYYISPKILQANIHWLKTFVYFTGCMFFTFDCWIYCFFWIIMLFKKDCKHSYLIKTAFAGGWLWFVANNPQIMDKVFLTCFWCGFFLSYFIFCRCLAMFFGRPGRYIAPEPDRDIDIDWDDDYCSGNTDNSYSSCSGSTYYNHSNMNYFDKISNTIQKQEDHYKQRDAELKQERLRKDREYEEQQIRLKEQIRLREEERRREEQRQREQREEERRQREEKIAAGLKIVSARQYNVNSVQVILANNERKFITGELVNFTPDTVTVKVCGRYQVKNYKGIILNSYQ